MVTDTASSARVQWTVTLRVEDSDGIRHTYTHDTGGVPDTALEAIDTALAVCDMTVVGLEDVEKGVNANE